MKAVRYYGAQDVRVETVPDPQIVNPRDAIIKITSTAICGSALHIYGGMIPTMKAGDSVRKRADAQDGADAHAQVHAAAARSYRRDPQSELEGAGA